MNPGKFGGQREIPIQEELDFCRVLESLTGPPFFDLWLHNRPNDQSPWMLVSLSFFLEGKGGVVKTLRLDFDGLSIKGGWSPSNLNWDAEVPAEEAGVNLSEPDGICRTGANPDELARLAASWFKHHFEECKNAGLS